jgi:hypothetical protein
MEEAKARDSIFSPAELENFDPVNLEGLFLAFVPGKQAHIVATSRKPSSQQGRLPLDATDMPI